MYKKINKYVFDYYMVKYEEKELNSTCYCDQRLYFGEDLSIIYPCEHLIHSQCDINLQMCPLCNTKINKVYNESDIITIINESKVKHNDILYQQYVDIYSIKNIHSLGNYSYINFMARMDTVINIFPNLMLSKNEQDVTNLIKKFFKDINLKIQINGKSKLYNGSKIFIGNHSSYLDGCIGYVVSDYNCKFIASSSVKKMMFGNVIEKSMPVIFVDRGKGMNTVQAMKDYILEKDGNNMFLFPEGMITHPKTIARFRTGAFAVGSVIQPIVIRFDPYVFTNSVPEFMFYIMSQKNIHVTVDILDPVFPPFSKADIEKIRYDMATVGNMNLSRVTSKDVKDPET